MEPSEELAYESQSILCYSGSYFEQCPSRMCGHCAHNLQVSGVLFYAWTVKFVRAKVCWGYVFLAYKRRVSNIISVKALVRRLPSPPDLLHQPCQRDKRNSTVKIIQGSKFKVQISKAYGKTRAAQAAPAAPLLTALCRPEEKALEMRVCAAN